MSPASRRIVICGNGRCGNQKADVHAMQDGVVYQGYFGGALRTPAGRPPVRAAGTYALAAGLPVSVHGVP